MFVKIEGARFYRMPPQRTIRRAAVALERRFDRRRIAGGRPILSPFRGFGRDHELLLRGRVLLQKPVTRARAAESPWRNMLNAYRRFQSDEVAGARVRASYRDAVVESVTDDEGYFRIRLEPRALAEHMLWHEVAIELVGRDTTAIAQVMIPSAAARFGIISDIDDTIVRTNATSLLGMARSVMRNAAARLPFEGVAELYRALHRDVNPIFYVSSSPWNLYELLEDFMDINGIPHGPMLLQDWGLDESTFLIASHATHKLREIRQLLDYYPSLPFVLIGDSGQHDPEIYLRVIQANPKRILAAFIRDVTADVRDRTVARIIDDARVLGVAMDYVTDSAEALRRAQELGLLA